MDVAHAMEPLRARVGGGGSRCGWGRCDWAARPRRSRREAGAVRGAGARGGGRRRAPRVNGQGGDGVVHVRAEPRPRGESMRALRRPCRTRGGPGRAGVRRGERRRRRRGVAEGRERPARLVLRGGGSEVVVGLREEGNAPAVPGGQRSVWRGVFRPTRRRGRRRRAWQLRERQSRKSAVESEELSGVRWSPPNLTAKSVAWGGGGASGGRGGALARALPEGIYSDPTTRAQGLGKGGAAALSPETRRGACASCGP